MEDSVPQTKGKTLENNRISRPWQGTALGIFSIIGILLITLLVGKLGYEGFKAGEMGIMIGIFAVSGLIFLIPLFILKVIMAIVILRGKKWAIVLMLVFTALSILGGIFSVALGFIFYIFVMLYHGLLMWAEIICLKHPYYNQKNPDKL